MRRTVRGATLQGHRESADLSLVATANAARGVGAEDLWAIERQLYVAPAQAMLYLAALGLAADLNGSPHYRWLLENDRWQQLLAA